MGPRLLVGREVPVPGALRARTFALGALVGARPLDDLEVPVIGSMRIRHFVPGVPEGLRPLHNREVPASCRKRRASSQTFQALI